MTSIPITGWVCTAVLWQALADAVMGINRSQCRRGCADIELQYQFYQQSARYGTAIVKSQVKHHGQTTMVIMAEMTDEQNNLLAAITTTMFIAGHFNEIPREW